MTYGVAGMLWKMFRPIPSLSGIGTILRDPVCPHCPEQRESPFARTASTLPAAPNRSRASGPRSCRRAFRSRFARWVYGGGAGVKPIHSTPQVGGLRASRENYGVVARSGQKRGGPLAFSVVLVVLSVARPTIGSWCVVRDGAGVNLCASVSSFDGALYDVVGTASCPWSRSAWYHAAVSPSCAGAPQNSRRYRTESCPMDDGTCRSSVPRTDKR
jgi:hypothetical protein